LETASTPVIAVQPFEKAVNSRKSVNVSPAGWMDWVAAIGWIVRRVTGSTAAAVAGGAVFALNPNVLYLQATPMTEPLLLATTTAAVALLIRSTLDVSPERRLQSAYGGVRLGYVGLAFALACLTRYEAWPVTVGALVCAVWARWRRGEPLQMALRRVGAIALYPAAAVLAFTIVSRIVVGAWFVSDGFFVPENTALGHPMEAVKQIVWGARALSSYALVVAAVVGLVALVAAGLADRSRAECLIAAAALGTAAVPWVAFVKGHPYRIRYMVPLMAIEAIAAGAAAGYFKRTRNIAAVALAVLALVDLRPLDLSAPMVVEAQWDRPNIAARQPVSDYLRAHYDGTSIMASMGSLGHYMQEVAVEGFSIRDFLHEGNGDIWLNALDNPRPFAGWILIEEKAEGGDALAMKARERPDFLAGYSRVADGAGLALYRRKEPGVAVDAQNLRLSVSR